MPLDPTLVDLVRTPAFAVLTTIDEQGAPSSQVIWLDCSDEELLVNTEQHRRKVRNVERDPRVTVVVLDPATPYRFIEARGRVVRTTTGDEARRHIDELALRYTGGPYASTIRSERVILHIEIDRLVTKQPSAWTEERSSHGA